MSVTAGHDGAALALSGRLDVRTVADVRAALHAALDSGQGPLVLDLSAALIMDATGLGVIVSAHRRAERLGRRLVLRGAPPQVLRLLVATRLHRILHLESGNPDVGETDPSLTPSGPSAGAAAP